MAALKRSLMEGVWALKCLKPLRSWNCRASQAGKPSALSLGRAGGLCSPAAPLPGDEGMGSVTKSGRSMNRGCSRGSAPCERCHLQRQPGPLLQQPHSGDGCRCWQTLLQGRHRVNPSPSCPVRRMGCEPPIAGKDFSFPKGKEP